MSVAVWHVEKFSNWEDVNEAAAGIGDLRTGNFKVVWIVIGSFLILSLTSYMLLRWHLLSL